MTKLFALLFIFSAPSAASAFGNEEGEGEGGRRKEGGRVVVLDVFLILR